MVFGKDVQMIIDELLIIGVVNSRPLSGLGEPAASDLLSSFIVGKLRAQGRSTVSADHKSR